MLKLSPTGRDEAGVVWCGPNIDEVPALHRHENLLFCNCSEMNTRTTREMIILLVKMKLVILLLLTTSDKTSGKTSGKIMGSHFE